MKKLLIMFLTLSIVFLTSYVFLTIRNDWDWDSNLVTFFSFLMGAIGALIGFFPFFSKKYPKAFNVAIIGFPKTGKTTLLTILLNEILINKIRNCHATIKGESTIEKLHDNMKKLRNGEPVGATTDETKFAYRTNITVGHTLFDRKEYKIEFGDFPGECSSELSTTSSSWLKDTSFFNWAIEADAYLFVIDVSICFIPDEYFPYSFNDIITGYISAWQHIIDNRTDNIDKIRQNPLLLVFTKSDILDYSVDNYYHHHYEIFKEENRNLRIESIKNRNYLLNEILQYSGITIDCSHIHKNLITESNKCLNKDYMEKLCNVVESDFKDLISFFRNENKKTKLVYTSAFFNDEKSSKYGINDLFSNIIPSV